MYLFISCFSLLLLLNIMTMMIVVVLMIITMIVFTYCNSISGIDFDACVVIDISFYIWLLNFVVIGQLVAQL